MSEVEATETPTTEAPTEAPTTEAPTTETIVPEEQTTENVVCSSTTAGEDDAEKEYIIDPILDTEEMKKIFVGGITPDSQEEELKEFFEKISGAPVTSPKIIKKDTEKKSCFGFVTLNSSQLVDDVLLRRAELNFKGRLLDVNRAVPVQHQRGAHERTKKLFVANLPKFNCTEDDLRKYFEDRHPEKYGTIESIQLIKKKDDKGNKMEENKGFGFIMASTEDFADKLSIQHATFEFGGRRIELKKSVPTEGPPRGGGGGGGGGQSRGGYNQGMQNPYNNYYGYGWGDYSAHEYYYPPQAYGGYPPYGKSPRGGRGRFTPY